MRIVLFSEAPGQAFCFSLRAEFYPFAIRGVGGFMV